MATLLQAVPAPSRRPGPAPSAPPALPAQLTSFVGREAELRSVRALLGETRLLTLTGAGGSGKTRLALEAAARAQADHAGGVRWIELAPLTRPELLPQHVATAAGVVDPGPRSWIDALLEHLEHASLLLVLDNCEHLVDACAELAETVLLSCPGVSLLATSREALGISGERAWLVPALSLPEAEDGVSPDRVAACEAVQLFVQRARAVHPDFVLREQNAAAVARICRRLDGLPLAIELAAARVRVLAPEQIAERLDDAFRLLSAGPRNAIPRHRTLREAIGWSHALLSAAEQTLFARLSVFAGSFGLDAAETVCGEGMAEVEVLDLLTALVDKSLVLVEPGAGEARYRLLETVRQFARERLVESGDLEELRRRHADFYLALAEAMEPEVFGGFGDASVMDRLDRETPNLRAAGDYFETDDAGPDGELRLYAALHWYWFGRARLREGRRRIAAALVSEGAATPIARARALAAAANFAFWQGDVTRVRVPAEEAVQLLEALDDPTALAFALTNLGMGHTLERQADRAREVLERALTLSRRVGDQRRLAYTLYWRARAAELAGDLHGARTALEEAVAIGRAQGWGPGVAHPGTVLARVQFLQGDDVAAATTYLEVLSALGAMGNHWGLAQALCTIGALVGRRGRPRQAAVLHGAAEALRAAIGSDFADDERQFHDAMNHELGHALGTGSLGEAHAEGRRLAFGDALALAEGEVRAVLEAAATGVPATPEPAPPAPAPGTRGAVPPAGPTPEPAPGLRVLALGPLEIHREGARIPPEAWSYARPRELLLYLLCHPRGRTRDQIGLAFWPGATPAQLKNSFHVTLHHLRKVLGGPDWVRFAEDRYVLSGEAGVEFDAERFEAEVSGLLPARGRGAHTAEEVDVAALERALALYRGPFLEGEVAGEWRLEPQDRLHRLWVDGQSALGEALLARGDTAAAAAVYRRLVLREDLHEAGYRGLMRALARLGDRAEAVRQYGRLTEALRDGLAAEPERETVQLLDRIRSADPV